jgi:hypothetical protein
MDSANLQIVPAPPSLMKSLMAGFDVVSNHIGLVLLPIIVDLLLWVGPRLRVAGLLQAALQQPEAKMVTPDPQVQKELMSQAIRLNLLANLRSLPVGIPSLMAGRAPLDSPLGTPVLWNAPGLGIVLGLWLLFTLVGLALGTVYFEFVTQAVLAGRVNLLQGLGRWLREYSQVLLLALVCLGLMMVLFIPLSCVLSVLILSGLSFEQISLIGFLLMGGILIWLIVPLAFSPHGIFVYQQNVLASVLQSLKMARMTFVITGLFLLAIVVLSQGLDMLWNIPVDTSWFLLVGIVGHAFVTTSLLAATLVYYRDINQWIRNLVQSKATKVA